MPTQHINPLPTKFTPTSNRAYRIINVVSNTVLDLSRTDHVSVIGWPMNGGKNQEWIIEPAGDYHTVINVHFRKYLGYQGRFGGASAIGVESPVQWAIIHDEEDPTALRFIIPNHDLNLELTEHGSPVSGTPVTVMKQNTERCQTWRLLLA